MCASISQHICWHTDIKLGGHWSEWHVSYCLLVTKSWHSGRLFIKVFSPAPATVTLQGRVLQNEAVTFSRALAIRPYQMGLLCTLLPDIIKLLFQFGLLLIKIIEDFLRFLFLSLQLLEITALPLYFIL